MSPQTPKPHLVGGCAQHDEIMDDGLQMTTWACGWSQPQPDEKLNQVITTSSCLEDPQNKTFFTTQSSLNVNHKIQSSFKTKRKRQSSYTRKPSRVIMQGNRILAKTGFGRTPIPMLSFPHPLHRPSRAPLFLVIPVLDTGIHRSRSHFVHHQGFPSLPIRL